MDGQFAGTTDEIFQWGACKWGLPDNLLRAIAVRESTWYQYETYPSNRCVVYFSCGDFFTDVTDPSKAYCEAIGRYGYDYERDYEPGICPKTFSIVGVMDWQDPNWGQYPDNQNGTFPFNRNSTAFAVDYIGSELRGCYEGWEVWLKNTGTGDYGAGDIWGCVGAWYAGEWHSDDADRYSTRVQEEWDNHTWLQPGWPSDKPGCDPDYGCPGPDTLGPFVPFTKITCDGSGCSTAPYGNEVTVALSATDLAGSGVAATFYTTDGWDPTFSSQTYSGPFTVSTTTTVKFFSAEDTGNREQTRTQIIHVDPTDR